MSDFKVSFFYKGKIYLASGFISLQDDLKVIFTALEDAELIEQFGVDIDFQTDLTHVIQTNVLNSDLLELQGCILGAVKHLPDFIIQSSQLERKQAST